MNAFLPVSLPGFGTCGLCICTVVSIQQHFDTGYVLPLSVMLLLGSLGNLVGAPCYHMLSEAYGWRGALLIASAITLHTIPCGYLFRGIINTASRAEHKYDNTLENTVSPRDHQYETLEDKLEDIEIKKTATATQRKYDTLVDNYERLEADDTPKEKHWLACYVNYDLLTKPVFLFYLLSRMFSGGATIVFYQETPSKAVSAGMSELNASLLISVMGIAMLISRIFTSVIINSSFVNRFLFYNVTTLLAAVGMFLYCFCIDFPTCVVLIGFTGVWFGK